MTSMYTLTEQVKRHFGTDIQKNKKKMLTRLRYKPSFSEHSNRYYSVKITKLYQERKKQEKEKEKRWNQFVRQQKQQEKQQKKQQQKQQQKQFKHIKKIKKMTNDELVFFACSKLYTNSLRQKPSYYIPFKKLFNLLGKPKNNIYRCKYWSKKIKLKKSCVYCGSTENLHAHHIFSVSKHPLLIKNKNNGIVLCGKCHTGAGVDHDIRWGYNHKIKRFQKMSFNYSLHSLNGQL